MPSPVSARRIGEWALRVLSLALLLVILARAWGPAGNSAVRESVKQASVGKSLRAWSRTSPAAVHLTLDSVLSPVQRDWLAAIERTGTVVTWNGPQIASTAATLTRVADPAGSTELAIAAPARSTIVVRDRVGPIDSIVAGRSGARLEIPGNATTVGVSVGGSTAWAIAPDSIEYKHILVEGAAGWETKFTIAALTERGWRVDAVSHVAPGVAVRAGAPTSPDTSRYAVIVAVDSTASLIANAATTFVHDGGGLVTLRDASSVGPRSPSSVVLERRADGEVRASRVGAGRVIRVGYKDLWRHRMTDDDTVPDPVAAHRALLARIVASVAYAPRIPLPVDSSADAAPLADMVDRVGPRSASADTASPFRSEVPSSILFGVLLVSLLLELASRRLRGVR